MTPRGMTVEPLGGETEFGLRDSPASPREDPRVVEEARLPPRLVAGDRVGVAALSGPVDLDRLERGMAALRDMGFVPVPASNLTSRQGLFAGSDGERLDAFHRLAADDSLGAIFFARGGHGLLRLLPRLDWDLLGRRPRFYVGYSDLTPFLLQVVDRLGLVAVHGPMVAADLARGLHSGERRWLQALLAGELPLEARVRTCGGAGGVVEGRLVGGCLSLLTATLGTPFAPRLDEGILFLEDTGEPLYRIDRMLTHLRLSGNLRRVRALLLGQWIQPVGSEVDPGEWQQWVEDLAGELGRPTATEIPAGHGIPNLALPLGMHARLDLDRGCLSLG